MRLIGVGWDAEAARRPHGQHTTVVVVHLDVAQRAAALHLGPLLSDADRQYVTCDATCEAGSNATASSSAPAEQPARSAAGFAAPSSSPRVRSPAAVHPRPARPPHPALGRRRPHRIG